MTLTFEVDLNSVKTNHRAKHTRTIRGYVSKNSVRVPYAYLSLIVCVVARLSLKHVSLKYRQFTDIAPHEFVSQRNQFEILIQQWCAVV